MCGSDKLEDNLEWLGFEDFRVLIDELRLSSRDLSQVVLVNREVEVACICCINFDGREDFRVLTDEWKLSS